MTGELVERTSIIVAGVPVYCSKLALEKFCHRIPRSVEPVGLNFDLGFVGMWGEGDIRSVIVPLAVEDTRLHGFGMSRHFDRHATTG